MELPNTITENLRFLTIEICNQLNRACACITASDTQEAAAALDKYDYIVNLSTIVQNHCVEELSRSNKKPIIVAMGCVFNMAACFNRIGSAAVKMIHHFQDYPGAELVAGKKTARYFLTLIDAIKLLDTGFVNKSRDVGHNICDRADAMVIELDDLAASEQLRESHTNDIEGVLTIAEKNAKSKYFLVFMLEQLAHELLVLGEAVLSLENAEFMTIRQLRALNSTLPAVANEAFFGGLAIEKIGETRSGCFISGITEDKNRGLNKALDHDAADNNHTAKNPAVNNGTANNSSEVNAENNTVHSSDQDEQVEPQPDNADSPEYLAIFKEGKKEKLKVEKKQFEAWNELFPGMAPKVIAYKKQGKTAALLVEYVKGKTFEQLLFAANQDALKIAVTNICQTLDKVWVQTQREAEPEQAASFMKQLNKRLRAVTRIHPEYDASAVQIGRQTIPSLRQLIERCNQLEDTIRPTFSVFTHGDFNIDNIIYDSNDGRPRFIDLHRSKYGDYLQDISVFMVSNFRVQVVDPDIRNNISRVLQSLYQFVCQFAEKQQDLTMQARLALGLARSYITSTRFVLDDGFANEMFFRGRYLMEKIVETPEPLTHFVLPQEILRG